MSIIRIRKDERYFTASNEPFVDETISWEARGLMGYLLTKPNNWEVRTHDLMSKGPAGEHKIRRMLAELRKAGYMNRIRITLPNKHFDWVTEVYESPSQNPRRNASGRFSTSGSSTSGKVPDIVITDSPSTESIKEHGAQPAPTVLSLEWQIATNQEKIVMPSPDDTFKADCEIAVMNICRGAVNLESLATEFITTRRIFPQKKQFSGWRKAFQTMYDAKPNRVYPQHVREAILQLTQAGMTVTDPFSIVKTAISLANPMPEEQISKLAEIAI